MKSIVVSMPAVLLAFFLGFAQVGCDSTPEPLRLQGETMGTRWHVTLGALPAAASADQVQAGLEQVLKTVNNQMSTWQQDSELSRFNQYQGADWFPVSPEMVGVVETAQQVSELSQGAYDITVGPLVNLWGFGPRKPEDKGGIPTEEAVKAALARTGYHQLQVQKSPPALRKSRPDVYVDLSSIAKGFGVDQAGLYLEAQGIHDYMVEIGGEVRTRGQSPRGDAWRIAIEKPTDLGRGVQQGMHLKDAGLATSGDYRNFFTDNGKRYSHTLDLKTGHPVADNLASVSVVAANTAIADAYATMFMALGEVKGRALADAQGMSVFFISRTDKGFETYATKSFKPLLIDSE